MPRRREEARERVTPSLLEYSFDQCRDEELSACCPYEFLASSESIRAAVERFRVGDTDRLAKAVVALFPINIAWALFERWWPRPYLEIPLAERRRNVLSPHRKRDLAYLVTPWTHLGDARRIIAIYVARAPLPTLKKAVADLLRRDYPHLLTQEPLGPEWRIQKRGRGSLIEQYRTDLKALSAWRLQKQFGYSAHAAIDLMRRNGLDTYRDERAFYRGVKRAAQKIKALERQLLKFAKRVTA